MAQVRGFQGVLNGNANGAGIVLPDSQTENYAIDQIAKNGLLNQQQAQANKAAQAQTAKDFATNQLKISPGILYRPEVSQLAQKWYDKGVEYRKQNFDVFNPDWSKPDQVQAHQEYIGEKQRIEGLSMLRDEVDKDYLAKQKLSEAGKMDGFDDYDKAIRSTTLSDLDKNGGITSLPRMVPKYDTSKVDEETKGKIVPLHDYSEVPVPGMPGVFKQGDDEYIDGKQAVRTAERSVLNQPGAAYHFNKIGVGDTNKLFTKGGHYMKYDESNPSDFGTIDQPAIMHQIAVNMLNNPDDIKNLPDGVKKRMIDASAPGVKLSDGTTLTASGKIVSPYDATKDPEFISALKTNTATQLKKEADYLNELFETAKRNTPQLRNSDKYDATLANIGVRQKQLYISQQNSDMNRQRLNDAEAKQAATNNGDSFIEKLRTGAYPEGGRELSNHFETNPQYGKPLKITEFETGGVKNGKIDIEVPAKLKPNPNFYPNSKESSTNQKFIESQTPYTIHLDRNDQTDWHSKLSGLIKTAGGTKSMNKESQMLPKTTTDLSHIFGN